MNREKIHIVWFKKDLRLHDHAPLYHALRENKRLLLLYILEPSVFCGPYYSPRHARFILQSLKDLNERATLFGGEIHLFHGEALPVFHYLNNLFEIRKIFSHQETNIRGTFERDKNCALFFKENGIMWQEFAQNGVVRGSASRKNRLEQQQEWLTGAELQPDFSRYREAPEFRMPDELNRPLPKEYTEDNPLFQPGGERTGQRIWTDFLNTRHTRYSACISKPALSRIHCSRISPYLTFGNLSLRRVYRETLEQIGRKGKDRNLQNFLSRLEWQGHFIQKFETECRIETENMNRGFDGIRQELNTEWLECWKNGMTGFPLVDAVMRCLKETGYVNFRMRAMTVSFWTHHLFQPWQPAAEWLASVFLDFEPGIHFPQIQMQAGTTGINLIRMYNPVKQSYEHDADGAFIKRWVPELKPLEGAVLHEPHTCSPMEELLYGFRPGVDYPLPMIDLKPAEKKAKELLYTCQNSPGAITESRRILSMHVKSKAREKAESEGRFKS
jgi:deoxyribodipyrimidine photo-lyase